jgi:hypothetical protein
MCELALYLLPSEGDELVEARPDFASFPIYSANGVTSNDLNGWKSKMVFA